MKKLIGLLFCTIVLSSVAIAHNGEQNGEQSKAQQDTTAGQVSVSKGFLSLFSLFTSQASNTDSTRKSTPVMRKKAIFPR
jgi:hypothetical protein